jgi:hypothetical protein
VRFKDTGKNECKDTGKDTGKGSRKGQQERAAGKDCRHYPAPVNDTIIT